MKQFWERLDPYHQSVFYFRYTFWGWLLFVGVSVWLCAHWNGRLVQGLLHNFFVYIPNYFTHEMAGHNLVGRLLWSLVGMVNGAWAQSDAGLALTIYLSGSATEVLLPLLACLGALQLAGGRYLLPPLLYWLASAFYSAGIYIADARACSLPLTSSNLVDNFPAGTPGDWNFILKPFGLLPYDVMLGRTAMFAGIICLVLAFWSAYYYWTHTEQYLYTENKTIHYYR